MSDFYRELFDKGALVFDIGAHMGNMTNIFLENGVGKVVALEPQLSVFKTLSQRFAFDKRVVALNFAAGIALGKADMFVCKSADTLSTFSEKWLTGRFKGYQFVKIDRHCTIVTLDWLIATYGMPEHIKIDVEGWERSVLEGLSHPVRSLSYEFTEEFCQEASLCAALIEKLGVYEFNYSRGDVPSFATQWNNFANIFKEIYNSLGRGGVWGNVFARIKTSN